MGFEADAVPADQNTTAQELYLAASFEPERLHSAGVALGTLNNAVYRTLANRYTPPHKKHTQLLAYYNSTPLPPPTRGLC
jgi:hypothetical protein